jgi:hypothetical protein
MRKDETVPIRYMGKIRNGFKISVFNPEGDIH